MGAAPSSSCPRILDNRLFSVPTPPALANHGREAICSTFIVRRRWSPKMRCCPTSWPVLEPQGRRKPVVYDMQGLVDLRHLSLTACYGNKSNQACASYVPLPFHKGASKLRLAAAQTLALQVLWSSCPGMVDGCQARHDSSPPTSFLSAAEANSTPWVRLCSKSTSSTSSISEPRIRTS